MKLNTNSDPKTGQVGSFYVRIHDAPVARTVPVKDPEDPEMLVDLDAKGRVVGVEVLGLDMMHALCKQIAKHLPSPYKNEVQELCETA
jgi:uncharacterized protein YuzE